MDHSSLDSGAPKPQPGVLKTIGILNIVFGAVLLAGGLGGLIGVVPDVFRGVPLRLDPGFTQLVFDELRREEIRTLRQRERAATTAGDRDRLKKQRLAIQAKHHEVQDEVDFPRINTALGWLGTYLRLDVFSGAVLNGLLVVSGIGLVLRKNWARLAALATAVLKIVRLLALTALLAGWVVPRMSAALESLVATDVGRQVVNQAMERQQTQQGGAPGGPLMSTEDLTRAFSGIGTGAAIFVACFGSVYPVVILILLSRPGARAASLGQ